MYATTNATFSSQPTTQGGEPSLFSPQTRRPQQEPQQQTDRKPGQKPPKTRTSCDSCATAKVRCSKERPQCQRCLECGFPCVYGLSMKHGKVSQKRRHPAFQPAIDGFQSTPLSSEQKYDNDLQQSFCDLLENMGSTANISPTQPWPSSNDATMNSTTMHSAPTVATSSAFYHPIWAPAIANGHAGISSTEAMSPTNHGPPSAFMDSIDDTLSLLSNTDFSQFINSEPSNSISSSSSSASPVLSNRNIALPQSQISNESSGTHDCYVIANSTLAILNVPSQPMSGDTTARVPVEAVQHLDEVLRCTRNAMGNVLHLLKCSCASGPQMAMLDASIIIRILFWHQVAAGVETSSSLPLDGAPLMDSFSRTGTTATGSHGIHCSASTTFVASEPIKIGNYIPDQEDQEPMRRLFLLISLKKLGRLIEIFAQVREAVEVGPSHIRGILTSWLTLELSQTIRAVKKGANATVGQQ